ncbi:hydroxyacid dehydrogenase, partial [Patescibacteria group bacterium]|nr:hydroxyacid dehydrogenase [Patescibacteria group bacterium]
MKKTVITFLELEKWEEKYLKDRLSSYKELSLNFFEKPLNSFILKKIKETDILATFIYSQINQEILSELPNLKFITTMSTGFDHIDINACKKRNIVASNVPYYGENTVAEHTFALILALSRKIT